ncbi:recombinase family protein [Vibrio sp. CyArs1]|uniref:recombinase family protein n=1 Tax=Vibrio sp. CyArs1 TaxID=2682577 RepID=UPI001F070BC8|nr:recombinase family protein [Vibrio sp. CyArs1]
MLIGYMRVSTKDQDLEIQEQALLKAGCEEIFGGKYSGKSQTNGEELQAVIDYSRKGDTVVVTKFDRLGRSITQVLRAVEALKSKGVHIVSLNDRVDTRDESPMSSAMMQLLAMFAELEHSMIVSRTTEGRVAAKNKGVKFGRKQKLDKKEVKKWRADNEASIKQTAEHFDLSISTVKRYCKD